MPSAEGEPALRRPAQPGPEGLFWAKLSLLALGLAGLSFWLALTVFVKGGTVTMPDLRGLPRAVAAHKLKGLGLELSVREERWSNSVPFGVVMEQSQEPGSELKRGRSIGLVLSLGTKSVAVPQLAGMASARQARLLLEQNGLSLGVQDEIHAPEPRDTVLAQSPEAGIEVARGDAVSLLVSLGPKPQARVMPDLRGRPLAEARSLASQLRLVLRRVTEAPAKGAPAGSILTQNLAPGTPASEGAELTLSVAAGGEGLGNARLVALAFEVPQEGVQERRLRITVKDARGERVVHSAMEKPGAKVKLEVKVEGAASYAVSLAGAVVEEKEIP